MADISNYADIMDSRDVIERLEELQDEIDRLKEAVTDAKEELDMGVTEDTEDLKAAQEALFEYAGMADAEIVTFLEESGFVIPDDAPEPSDEMEEYLKIKAFAEEGEQYAGDWSGGETLIREDHFEDYAQELAEDIGAIDRDAPWPIRHIDWVAAAAELKQDYSEIEFDGITYLVRS